MAGMLTDYEQFQTTTFHVIDFETQPRGYRPEPIEVAVISLLIHTGELHRNPRFAGLMRPPPMPRSRPSTSTRPASPRRWSRTSRPPRR